MESVRPELGWISEDLDAAPPKFRGREEAAGSVFRVRPNKGHWHLSGKGLGWLG